MYTTDVNLDPFFFIAQSGVTQRQDEHRQETRSTVIEFPKHTLLWVERLTDKIPEQNSLPWSDPQTEPLDFASTTPPDRKP